MSKILFVHKKTIPELQLLRDELISRGHVVDVWFSECLSPNHFVDGTLVNLFAGYDLIYYRNGLSDAGIFMLPSLILDKSERLINQSFLYHPLCFNKIYQSFFALKVGLQVPPTFIGGNISFDYLVSELGLPFIAKVPTGAQGKGVYLVDSEASFKDCLANLQGDVLWQKYIPNDGDYRIFTIGGEPFAAYKRLAAPGNFKNNISQGGKGEKITDQKLLAKLYEWAAKISQTLKVEISGVDIIVSAVDGEFYFTEINVNPGWLGLDEALNVSTASAIADYFERRANSSSTFPL